MKGSKGKRDRRRRERSDVDPDNEAGPGTLSLNVNEVAAAVSLAGFVLLFVGIALLASGSRTSDQSAPPAGKAVPVGSSEQAIESLARRSIEVLPAGEWPSLYDSFTSKTRQRCPREQFDQAGVDAATQFGDDLQSLGFKRLESVTIEGATASAVIVGELAGLGEYQVQAAFQVEDGAWRIKPVASSKGCQAFGSLDG